MASFKSMDPLTHLMTGACLARAGFYRKTAYATAAMTLAAEAPDLDMTWYMGGPVVGFAHHRGLTHTFLAAPFMALAITGVLFLFARLRDRLPLRISRCNVAQPAAGGVLLPRRSARPVRWGWVFLLAFLADLSHLLLDFTNSYGIRLCYPFNDRWYAWSIMSVVSPAMLLVLAVGLAVPLLLWLVGAEMRRGRRSEFSGRGWAIAALTTIVAMWGLRAVERGAAIHLMRENGSATTETFERMAAEPDKWNPFTWRVLASTASGYQTAIVHTLSGMVDPGEKTGKPYATAAVIAAQHSTLGQVYGKWSKWPLAVDLGATPPPGSLQSIPADATTVRFSDLRYAPIVASLGASPPVAGYVVVAADGSVLSQWMGRREQR